MCALLLNLNICQMMVYTFGTRYLPVEQHCQISVQLLKINMISKYVGSGGRAVECRTVNRGHLPVSFGRDTKKTGGPIYLVSMPGEVKDL